MFSSYNGDPCHLCGIQDSRNRNSRSVLQLTSLFTPSVKIHLCISWYSKATASGYANVGMVLNEMAETALLDLTPLRSRLCAET